MREQSSISLFSKTSVMAVLSRCWSIWINTQLFCHVWDFLSKRSNKNHDNIFCIQTYRLHKKRQTEQGVDAKRNALLMRFCLHDVSTLFDYTGRRSFCLKSIFILFFSPINAHILFDSRFIDFSPSFQKLNHERMPHSSSVHRHC